MRVLFLDTKPNNPNRYISRAVFAALKRHPEVHEVTWASYTNAVDLVQRRSYDLFLAFDGEESNNAVVAQLCALIPRRAIWFTEDPYETYRNVEVARLFDVVFTNDAASLTAYRCEAHHLPLAADREMHFIPEEAGAPLYDLFFAGSAWPNRLDFLAALRERRPDLRMKLILVTNPALDDHIREFRDAFEFSPGVSIRDFSRIASRSLLTLALPRRFSTDPANTKAASDTPGPRLFEVALAGSAQLVDRGTTPVIADLFPQDAFFTYTNLDGCLEAIDRARTEPDLARAAARKAQQHALAMHLYEHRVGTILARMRARPRAELPSRTQKSRVLVLAHNIAERGRFGGSEIYLDQIRKHVAGSEVWILVPAQGGESRRLYTLIGPDGQTAETLRLNRPWQLGDLVHPEFEAEFQSILGRFGFDIVHVNHLIGFPFSVLYVAKAYGAQVIFSLHDYHLICDNFNLISFEGRYCNIPERPDPETCDICLSKTRGWPIGAQARRRRFMGEALSAVDRILVGSKASSEILLRMYPHLRAEVLEIPPPMNQIPAVERPAEPGDVLEIALLGNFTWIKGGRTALAVFEACRELPVRFHIFGRVDEDLEGQVSEFEADYVVRHGVFSPGIVPAEVGRCRVALFLSPWPETYCISLSEAQALGLVPVVTPLGGQGERVRHDWDGFHVPVNQPRPVVELIERLSREPSLVQEVAARLPTEPGISGPDFGQRIETLYGELTATRRPLPRLTAVHRTLSAEELDRYVTSPRWLPEMPFPSEEELLTAEGVIPAPDPSVHPAEAADEAAQAKAIEEAPFPAVAPSSVPMTWTNRTGARMRVAAHLAGRFVSATRDEGFREAASRSRSWVRTWRERKSGDQA